MKRLALIFILLVTATSLAQSSDESKSGGRVKSDKPTVYLEYDCQDKTRVYLRMHNNTIWHISVIADEVYYPSKIPIKLRNGVNTYAAPNDKAIPLQYRIEKWALPWENVKVPKYFIQIMVLVIGLLLRTSFFFQFP